MTTTPLLDWLGRHPDITYPLNYGFLPDTLAGEGHPVDAYILGVRKPVERFFDSEIIVAIP